MPPDRGLADKRSSGVKGDKVRLTYLFTANADGSEKLPPLIIGKALKPRAFGHKSVAQHGFHYKNNAKAWMTGDIYQDWLWQWDRKLGARNRKIVLLQDNFSGHIIPNGLQNIRVANFEPNLTAHIQPMDQGIIRCFKAHYRAMFIQRAIDLYDGGTDAAKIYKINQLEAMWLADLAWREVDTTTIRHCWGKAGILPAVDPPALAQPAIPISSLLRTPSCDQDPIATVENKLSCALDDLEATGILHRNNRMDIKALLNPPDESWTDKTTDEEIFQAVLDAHDSQDEGDMDDDEEDTEPCPTYCEAFRAAAVLARYVGHVDNPIARKLEADLASFGRQMRLERSQALTTTHITDYFDHI